MTAPSKAERDEIPADTLAGWREGHRSNPGRGYCLRCGEMWPCTATRLLDALDEADRRERAVRELHTDRRNGQCSTCADWQVEVESVDLPCPTLAALDGPSQKLQP